VSYAVNMEAQDMVFQNGNVQVMRKNHIVKSVAIKANTKSSSMSSILMVP
jgi:hypothetical protein